jgi:hypothetical protein
MGKTLEVNFNNIHLLEENFKLVNKLTEENIKNIEVIKFKFHLFFSFKTSE